MTRRNHDSRLADAAHSFVGRADELMQLDQLDAIDRVQAVSA